MYFCCLDVVNVRRTERAATCSVVDVYRRHIRADKDEKHYVIVSRVGMALWGIYAVFFAQYASKLGSLVEAVNILGSLFYGTMLAIFLIAFYLKWIDGTATFWGAIAGEAVVLYCFFFTQIPWLWYNVIGCGVVVGCALLLQLILGRGTRAPAPLAS
jgi:Na+/proline symporter